MVHDASWYTSAVRELRELASSCGSWRCLGPLASASRASRGLSRRPARCRGTRWSTPSVRAARPAPAAPCRRPPAPRPPVLSGATLSLGARAEATSQWKKYSYIFLAGRRRVRRRHDGEALHARPPRPRRGAVPVHEEARQGDAVGAQGRLQVRRRAGPAAPPVDVAPTPVEPSALAAQRAHRPPPARASTRRPRARARPHAARPPLPPGATSSTTTARRRSGPRRRRSPRRRRE